MKRFVLFFVKRYLPVASAMGVPGENTRHPPLSSPSIKGGEEGRCVETRGGGGMPDCLPGNLHWLRESQVWVIVSRPGPWEGRPAPLGGRAGEGRVAVTCISFMHRFVMELLPACLPASFSHAHVDITTYSNHLFL